MKTQTNLSNEVLAQVGAVLTNCSDQSTIVRQKVRTLQWRGHQELFQQNFESSRDDRQTGGQARAYLDEALPRCFGIDVRELDSGLVDKRTIGRVRQPTENLAEEERRSRSNDLRLLGLLCSNGRLYP